MKKNYLFILFLALTLSATQYGFAQNNVNKPPIQQNIEGLSIYPNPSPIGRTFINVTSKRNLTKKIEFFNVLGKQIRSVILAGKELNISNLSKGVYILKITESSISETRKLVIK
ncbi:T9SS type A sorting domain-containing protein [Flavivirga rizhaonensis]|uniref:T9SS type A sorting domain-containing protein n=1 Tax=Flavivirga rizhaonensis TaxID=2559571 RepID=A0A4S1DY09_9FLAO|nr:T9SS type A sorting domain-containing protein [Flavivirga rizhaonensis]TGV02843.1 T9SS type A sorting domain-containing protein [Flavivirga rizhaonensis]